MERQRIKEELLNEEKLKLSEQQKVEQQKLKEKLENEELEYRKKRELEEEKYLKRRQEEEERHQRVLFLTFSAPLYLFLDFRFQEIRVGKTGKKTRRR